VEGVVKGSVRVAVAAFDVAGEHAVDADRAKLETTDSLESTPFNFTCVRQARDTAMLCPKCPLDGDHDHSWDCTHQDKQGTCNHCRYYCTQATIRMLNLFYGRLSDPTFPGISQDRISLHCGTSFGIHLGHKTMLGPMAPQTWVPQNEPRQPAFPWALGLTAADIDEALLLLHAADAWQFFADSLVTFRPAFAAWRVDNDHAVGICGATIESGIRKLCVADPGTGSFTWFSIEHLISKQLWSGYTVKNNLWPTVRTSVVQDEEAVKKDTDEDGVVDIDESLRDQIGYLYRFPAVTLNPNLPDSNGPLPPSNDKLGDSGSDTVIECLYSSC
jgi:hypothetical protein